MLAKLFLASFTAIFLASTTYVFMQISNAQPQPYMDEIFHIPQAKNYCAGNFSYWDPMITTLPGLYLTSIGLMKPLAFLLTNDMMELCTTFWLRTTNCLYAMGNFYLIYALLRKTHNQILDPDGVRLCMTTLALATLPVLYFFTFLYYTEAGSTFYVLYMYLLHLHGNHGLAAVMGTVSIMFRQTNIVWVAFVTGLAVRRCLAKWSQDQWKDEGHDWAKLGDWDLFSACCVTLWTCLKKKRSAVVKLVLDIVRDTWSYLLLAVGFMVFVYMNNGIAVGDRTHHKVGLHFPQLFYFLCMANFFACFHLVTPYKIWDFMKFCWNHPFFVAIFIAVSTVLIHNFTYEHEYLLADNRHYPFYVWSKIYKRHEYVRYALVPIYLYGFWSFTSELVYRDVFWKLVYITCVVLTLVPQQLLEYRYFIVPYLLFRVNMKYGSALALLHEILLYSIVNIATVYLFINKPFTWPHEAGVQRFMW